MPLLFSLAIHNALEEVRGQMQEEELLFAFLDDIYIVSSPAGTRIIYNLLQTFLRRMAGIQQHEGKTRVWNRAGVCPPDVAELGDEVWSPRGVKILETPVGSPEFVHGCGEPSIGCRNYNARSKFWRNAPGPGVTTSSARCHPVSRVRMLKAATQA